MKKTYEMNGKVYGTLTAMAKELGKSRLYVKDFAKYGIREIDDEEVKIDRVIIEDVDYDDDFYNDDEEEIAVIPEDDDDDDDELIDESEEIAEIDAVAELEKDVVDLTIDEFAARLKGIDTVGLAKMAENAGVNTWETMANEAIRRMRLIMELKAAYYPELAKKSLKPSTGASPWKAIPTEKLVESAKKNGAEYKECDDAGITRMRVIMALKAIGVKAESFK